MAEPGPACGPDDDPAPDGTPNEAPPIAPAHSRALVLTLWGAQDHPHIRQAIGHAGLWITAVTDPATLAARVAADRPDLVIADAACTATLPDLPGLLRYTRTTESLPLLVIAAPGHPAAPGQLPRDIGADTAFLQIRAALRRDRVTVLQEIRYGGGFTLDEAGFRILHGTRQHLLSKTDMCLIGPFFDAPARLLDRGTLHSLAFNATAARPGQRLVDFHLNRTRRAMRAALGADPIVAVRGRGYRLLLQP